MVVVEVVLKTADLKITKMERQIDLQWVAIDQGKLPSQVVSNNIKTIETKANKGILVLKDKGLPHVETILHMPVAVKAIP
jgi:hypothetical protein